MTPRFLPTCTPELLRGLGALAAKHDVSIQSHSAPTWARTPDLAADETSASCDARIPGPASGQ